MFKILHLPQKHIINIFGFKKRNRTKKILNKQNESSTYTHQILVSCFVNLFCRKKGIEREKKMSKKT